MKKDGGKIKVNIFQWPSKCMKVTCETTFPENVANCFVQEANPAWYILMYLWAFYLCLVVHEQSSRQFIEKSWITTMHDLINIQGTTEMYSNIILFKNHLFAFCQIDLFRQVHFCCTCFYRASLSKTI